MNVITGSPSRYYRAGEEIPDEEVPLKIAASYAVTGDDDGALVESPPLFKPAPPPKRQPKAGKRARR